MTDGRVIEIKNKYEDLRTEDDIEVSEIDVEAKKTDINEIRKCDLTRIGAMNFCVTDVHHPLASATKVVEAGNRVVLEEGNSYIENIKTNERMALRKSMGVYKMDVVYEDGEVGSITLDSGAGISVWPKDLQKQVKMGKKTDHKLRAANGTEIKNFGSKEIRFQARKPEEKKRLGFTGRV